MPSTALIRAYRARFLRHCIDELLYQTRGDNVEGTSTQWMLEHVSDTLDRVVEQVIAAYESARERWVHNRSAVLTMRVKAVLAGENLDLNLAQSALGYRLQQRHLGVVLWVANTASGNHDPLDNLGRVASASGVAAGSRKAPLFVACDETSAWAWLAITPEAGLDATSLRQCSATMNRPSRWRSASRRPALRGSAGLISKRSVPSPSRSPAGHIGSR